jgi:hypothetical protein
MVEVDVTKLIEKSESTLRHEYEKADRALHARMNDKTKVIEETRRTLSENNLQMGILTARVEALPDLITNSVEASGKVIMAYIDKRFAEHAADTPPAKAADLTKWKKWSMLIGSILTALCLGFAAYLNG